MIKKLDILIPVYNESEIIVKTIKQILDHVKCNYEIFICYDYDEDPTLHIIKNNFHNNTKINFTKNNTRGFNQALISGINNTQGEAVLVYMADDHENYKLIDECFDKFNEGFDVVCPSRFIEGGKMKGNTFVKEILTRLASFFFQYFTTFPIKDSTNAFRLFSRTLLKKINFESDKGFTLCFEITAKAHRLGCKIVEVPSIWIQREQGESRFKIFSFLPPYIKWLFYIIKTSLFFRK
jgi:dolichol-phosphate mannosyltransferase